MNNIYYLWLIPFLPLVGFVINALFGKKLPKAVVHWVANLAVWSSFVVAVVAFFDLISIVPSQRVLIDPVYKWIFTDGLGIDIKFMLDPLSAVMILVVTGVSSLIHLYSIGYMHDDPSYYRYFAYLNLFVFSMSLLVLGGNIVLMFVGWEGVGLCSYLLIGFWFEDEEKAYAGRKAFITNRIGDFGFILGILLMLAIFKTLDFTEINKILIYRGDTISTTALTLIGLFLFVGATGKSAQIPLYVWLPDAMAGPTPVSALIHAATMVTAGVYMIGRLNLLYAHAPIAMAVVAAIAGATAFFAATMAITQNDIKKVLAYSTVSQLGYMFMAMGVGAFAAGIFHLMTHAFFKALLFLGSGSVIHAMSGIQDMRQMGGLKKYMPITYWTFLTATLAISGIPPFAGFFSKDEIIWSTFASSRGGVVLWAVGVITAIITAFYMFRLVYMTFHGEERIPEEVKHHVHESPAVMTIPLIVLAILSVIGGWVGISPVIGKLFGAEHSNIFEEFLHPVFAHAHIPFHHYSEGTEWAFMAISVGGALLGILAAFYLYVKRTDLPRKIALKVWPLYKLLYNKYYVDEIYYYLIIHPIYLISLLFLWRFTDVGVIDGVAVNGSAKSVKFTARIMRFWQNGDTQVYIFSFIVGVVLVLGYLLLV